MASACINNIGLSPDNFLECSYAWLACEMPDDASNHKKLSDLGEEPDLDLSDIADFEFRLEDPVMMLPADQLFSDGKLIPLHLPPIQQEATPPDTPKPRRRMNGVSVADSFLYSPKAPRCSSRWKELLGLRKLYNAKQDTNRTPSSCSKSIKNFLNRSSKSSNDSSVNLPLLKDTDSEPTSVSSRLSLPDEVPRLSLDSEKPGKLRMRMVKTRTLSSDGSRPMRCPAETTVNFVMDKVDHGQRRRGLPYGAEKVGDFLAVKVGSGHRRWE